MSFCGSKDVILRVKGSHFVGIKMSFCGLKDVIFRVKRFHFSGEEVSFLGLKTSFYGPFGCKIFGNRIYLLMGLLKSSLCGCKDVILQVYSCHFEGLKISFCGSKVVILCV